MTTLERKEGRIKKKTCLGEARCDIITWDIHSDVNGNDIKCSLKSIVSGFRPPCETSNVCLQRVSWVETSRIAWAQLRNTFFDNYVQRYISELKLWIDVKLPKNRKFSSSKQHMPMIASTFTLLTCRCALNVRVMTSRGLMNITKFWTKLVLISSFHVVIFFRQM